MLVLKVQDMRYHSLRNRLRSTYTQPFSFTILRVFMIIHFYKPYILTICPAKATALTRRTSLVRIGEITPLATLLDATDVRTLYASHIDIPNPINLTYRIGGLLYNAPLSRRHSSSSHNATNLNTKILWNKHFTNFHSAKQMPILPTSNNSSSSPPFPPQDSSNSARQSKIS